MGYWPYSLFLATSPCSPVPQIPQTSRPLPGKTSDPRRVGLNDPFRFPRMPALPRHTLSCIDVPALRVPQAVLISRHRFSIRATCAGFALLAAACGERIPVKTDVAPDARLVRLRNFMVLTPAGAAKASASSDPLVRNPATLHTISFELLLAFQARGYFADTASADFAVAYYAAERLPVDTAVFSYGYNFAPYPWWQDEQAATQPPSGDSVAIVIVDVLNPKTKALLWRSEGVVRLKPKPGLQRELEDAVNDIVGQFQAGVGSGRIAPAPLSRGGRRR